MRTRSLGTSSATPSSGTSRLRYLAFFYSNATAFVSSLVVLVLVLILAVIREGHSTSLATLCVLRKVTVLDLLGLIRAYAAGTFRDGLTAAYSSFLMAGVVVYLLVNLARSTSQTVDNDEYVAAIAGGESKWYRKVLMLLATFTVSATYAAGPSAPRGLGTTLTRAATARATRSSKADPTTRGSRRSWLATPPRSWRRCS
jgi:hypothetical protein